MLPALVLALAPTASLAAPRASHEDGVDDPGHVIVSLRRLFPPVSYARDTQEGTRSIDEIAWGSAPSHLDSYGLPRLGLDFVVTRRFTLGVDLFGVASFGGDTPSTRVNALGVAARAGYILPLGKVAFAWLTGGPEEVAQWDAWGGTQSNGPSTFRSRYSQLGLVAEAHLVITPVPGFGITAGVASDVPLYGRYSTETTTAAGSRTTTGSATSLRIAAATGVLAVF